MSKIKEIVTYPQKCVCTVGNDISDVLLSGVWITGVAIGLVKGSAVRVKRTVIGAKRKQQLPIVVKPGYDEDKELSALSEEAKGLEEGLRRAEEEVDRIEKQVKKTSTVQHEIVSTGSQYNAEPLTIEKSSEEEHKHLQVLSGEANGLEENLGKLEIMVDKLIEKAKRG